MPPILILTGDNNIFVSITSSGNIVREAIHIPFDSYSAKSSPVARHKIGHSRRTLVAKTLPNSKSSNSISRRLEGSNTIWENLLHLCSVPFEGLVQYRLTKNVSCCILTVCHTIPLAIEELIN